MTPPVPAWDGQDIRDLLALDEIATNTFRTRYGDANAHGRAYGGQILAQALAAAARTVPVGRVATAMQFMFLQGTLHDQAVDLVVTLLQDGKRFSARHVRGIQGGGRLVFDAQVSYSIPIDAPAHAVAADFGPGEPESLPTIGDLPPDWASAVAGSVGYQLALKDVLDFRLVAPPPRLRLDAADARLRFWVCQTRVICTRPRSPTCRTGGSTTLRSVPTRTTRSKWAGCTSPA